MHLSRTAAATVAAATVLGLSTAPASAVVGGTDADAASTPWLAAIGTPLFVTRAAGQFCGGALVAPDQVLTAAHCVDLARTVPQALTVTFGRSELGSDEGATVHVSQIRVHPDFRDTDFDGETVHHSDLAVLTLDQPRPGPYLDIETSSSTTPSGTVFGWGATSEDDDSNTRLRRTDVPLVPDADCAAVYGSAFDPAEMLCAGSSEADTAQFDSGGPLLVDGKLVGLTSWAKGAARPGFPGVYTRLSTVHL